MKRFLLKRLVSALVTLWLLATIVFAIVNVLPGNVARQVLGPFALEADVVRFNEALGTNDPLIQQYFRTIGRLVTLDFGNSYQNPDKSVNSLVFPSLGNSAKLALLALVITVPISIAAGVFAARRKDKIADRVIVNLGLASSSIPEFVVAAVLMSLFAVKWKLGSTFAYPDDFGSLILPAMAMVLTYFGYIARMTRTGVITNLAADYTRTATMKGMSKGVVMRRHVLRNALAPTITVVSVQIGYLFGGIIGIEKVFNYPGLGSLMLRSVGEHDVPVLQACVLLVGLIYMVSTLLADLLIAYLNPRVRLEGAR